MADSQDTPTLPASTQTIDPLAPRGPLSCEINMAALRKLSPKELRDFSTVMSVIGDVLVGFSCQPRFFQNGGMRLNGAGELMETVADLVTGYRQAAYNVAKASTPTDSDGVEWRGWTLLGFETDMADDLAALAVTAAETVRDESEARFREQHR